MKITPEKAEAALRSAALVLAGIYRRPTATSTDGREMGADSGRAEELEMLARRKNGHCIRPADGEAFAAALKGV